jgi:tetratricopeptide (TPR) repeat protein
MPKEIKSPGKISSQDLPSKTNKKIFYIILILIPVLFFILLELVLRYFDYGLDFEQWVESNNGQWVEKGGKFLMLNPNIARKYFHISENIPISNQEAFDKIKQSNSFRVFILGESSAAGYPFEPNGSFSRYLKNRLTLVYPNSKIEVINCSMSAINSYTLRDLTPGILEQKPDLILIYAGHNEYYGALGAGSIESAGNFRFVVNLVLSLEKFRTFQLIRDAVNIVVKLFSNNEASASGTLMERMVRDKYIAFESDIYKKGLSQFEENMNDILELITDANIPVIIGTLTCNIKDQPPFVSVSSSKYPEAEIIYSDANQALIQNNFIKADSLFHFAKDLDALRFRAPGEINNIIYKLAEEFSINVLNIDSAFKAESPHHIVGTNLIVDHLHPTLHGYQQIGKLFFNKMKKLNYLPGSKPENLSDIIQDSIIVANTNFTALDSVMADYKVKILKNNWPFVNDTTQFSYSVFIQSKNRIDSLALQWTEHKIRWKDAHLLAAGWYIEKNDVSNFLREMDAVISQYPYVTEYYKYVATTLLTIKRYADAYNYLYKIYTIEPNAFATKWLGSIHLNKGKLDSARFFLNQSLLYNNRDPQVWYNLAVTYLDKDKDETLDLINRALAIDPNYYNALVLRNQLLNSMK